MSGASWTDRCRTGAQLHNLYAFSGPLCASWSGSSQLGPVSCGTALENKILVESSTVQLAVDTASCIHAFHPDLKRLMAVPTGVQVLEPSPERYGHDGAWSTFTFGVGDPPQQFQLLPSLTGSQLGVPDPRIDCENFTTFSFDSRPDCIADRGGPRSSTGLTASQTEAWLGQYDLIAHPTLFNDSRTGDLYLDNVTFSARGQGQPVEVAGQTVLGITAREFWVGIVGLGISVSELSEGDGSWPSLLASLKAQNVIGSLSFGYAAGNAGSFTGASLILGGYDSARSDRNLTLPVDDHLKTLPLRLWNVFADNSLQGGSADLLLDTADIDVFLDTSTSQIWLPASVCQRFADAFGLQYDHENNLYVTISGTHEELRERNPSLTFKVGSRDSRSQSVDIEMQYIDFDLVMGQPYYSEEAAYFPIRNATTPDQYVLGRAFLQKAYVVVDWERKNFTVGRLANTSSINIEAISSIDRPPSEDHLSAGGVTGIVVACVSAMLIAAAFLFLFRRRKQKERDRKLSVLAPTVDTIEMLNTGTLVNTDLFSETASCQKKRLDSGASELPEGCRDHELGSEPILEMEGDEVMPEPTKEEREQSSAPVERELSVHELA